MRVADELRAERVACLADAEADLADTDLVLQLDDVERLQDDVKSAEDVCEETEVPVCPSIGKFVRPDQLQDEESGGWGGDADKGNPVLEGQLRRNDPVQGHEQHDESIDPDAVLEVEDAEELGLQEGEGHVLFP